MNQTRKNYTKDKYHTDIDQQKQLAVAAEKTRRAREKQPIRKDRELERRIASQNRKKRIQILQMIRNRKTFLERLNVGRFLNQNMLK